MRRIGAQGREARGRTGEGGEGAKKCKKPQESYRRDVENGRDLGGRRKKRQQESVGSVGAERGYYVCMVVTYRSINQPGKGCQSCSWSAEQGK